MLVKRIKFAGIEAKTHILQHANHAITRRYLLAGQDCKKIIISSSPCSCWIQSD